MQPGVYIDRLNPASLQLKMGWPDVYVKNPVSFSIRFEVYTEATVQLFGCVLNPES
jgi:hypothetical protein